MCRILFLKGKNTSKALEYIDAFYKAGNNDPYLKDAADFLDIPEIDNKHLHGWGYLLVTRNKINTYLSGESFFDDKKGFKDLKRQVSRIAGEFMLMAELRVTDEGFVSALNSHPFHFVSRNGYETYFFYNGLLDYEKLAKSEKIDYSKFKNKNGTIIMGLSISAGLEAGLGFKKSLERPKMALKSGYNIMSFVHDDKGKYKAYVNAFSLEKLMNNSTYYDYTKLIKKDDEDLFFAGSSTIGLYKKDDYIIMKNGELLQFDIDFIDEYCFNKCV